MATKEVHVWLDESSEGPDDARWIVSLSEGDYDETLAVYEDEVEALAVARHLARSRGLSVVRVGKHGERRVEEARSA